MTKQGGVLQKEMTCMFRIVTGKTSSLKRRYCSQYQKQTMIHLRNHFCKKNQSIKNAVFYFLFCQHTNL